MVGIRTALTTAACLLMITECAQRTRSPLPSGRATPAPTARAMQRLHAQAGQLLVGGVPAFERRLRELRGVPVVVNQWASWCGPCRAQVAFFVDAANHTGGRLAVLGVNAQDARPNAAAAIAAAAPPYPQFLDIDAAIARSFGGGRAWPTTAFFASTGRLVHLHHGGFRSFAAFQRELSRYASG